MRDQTSEQSAFEKNISDAAKETPLITFGYIGNFERWGDDRKLFLWISNLWWENGNRKDIWSCNAVDLDRREQAKALRALRKFKDGYDAAKKEAENTDQKPCLTPSL